MPKQSMKIQRLSEIDSEREWWKRKINSTMFEEGNQRVHRSPGQFRESRAE